MSAQKPSRCSYCSRPCSESCTFRAKRFGLNFQKCGKPLCGQCAKARTVPLKDEGGRVCRFHHFRGEVEAT